MAVPAGRRRSGRYCALTAVEVGQADRPQLPVAAAAAVEVAAPEVRLAQELVDLLAAQAVKPGVAVRGLVQTSQSTADLVVLALPLWALLVLVALLKVEHQEVVVVAA